MSDAEALKRIRAVMRLAVRGKMRAQKACLEVAEALHANRPECLHVEAGD